MLLGSLYLEHLSDKDLGLLMLAGARHDVWRHPEELESLIDSPATFHRLFTVPGRDPLLRASPFLLFAVLIHRVVRDLGQASFIEEWVGPRQRVPVFDTGSLRDFGADPLRRLFLAELLASYTNVASGSTPGGPAGSGAVARIDGRRWPPCSPRSAKILPRRAVS